jgi:hypothetical protein
MLTIILGNKNLEQYLKDKKFVEYNDGLFDEEYQEDWYNDDFIKRIMHEIDHIDLTQSDGVTFKNSITQDRHTHRELSTSCKTLILIYKYPNVVFQARFGDNCTDLLEEIASKHAITIKSDYMHFYNFKYIHEINYINYNKIATNINDLLKIFVEYIEYVDTEYPYEEEEDDWDDNSDETLKLKHPGLYDDLVAVGTIKEK